MKLTKADSNSAAEKRRFVYIEKNSTNQPEQLKYNRKSDEKCESKISLFKGNTQVCRKAANSTRTRLP